MAFAQYFTLNGKTAAGSVYALPAAVSIVQYFTFDAVKYFTLTSFTKSTFHWRILQNQFRFWRILLATCTPLALAWDRLCVTPLPSPITYSPG